MHWLVRLVHGRKLVFVAQAWAFRNSLRTYAYSPESEMVRRSQEFPGVEWVEGAGRFIEVAGERCNGCGNCLRVCLGSCFEIIDRKARVRSLDTCMECASCWYVCLVGAIRFSWPKGGTGFRTEWG